MLAVKISKGNSKMGRIPSVSLPAGLSCDPKAPCYKLCYARRIECRWKNVHNSYTWNWELLLHDMDAYFERVGDVLAKHDNFRFHVSGDIPSREYLRRMCEVVRENPNCGCLVFTKRYEWINEYLDEGNSLPKNMHLLFSVWRGFDCPNPHNLPETHVLYRDGTCTATGEYSLCGGNCSVCFDTNTGCWNSKCGDRIVFKQH